MLTYPGIEARCGAHLAHAKLGIRLLQVRSPRLSQISARLFAICNIMFLSVVPW